MRAREPDSSGVIERDGVKVAYDVYGEGHTPTAVIMSGWTGQRMPPCRRHTAGACGVLPNYAVDGRLPVAAFVRLRGRFAI